MSQPLLTCLTCETYFPTQILQREHYTSEWHRHNLIRTANQMNILTKQKFIDTAANNTNTKQGTKLQQQQQQQQPQQQETSTQKQKCKICSKLYATDNAFANHLLSKRHIELTTQYEKEQAIKEAAALETDKTDTQQDPSLQMQIEHNPKSAGRKRNVIDVDENADEATIQEQLIKKFENATRLTDSQCLFCKHTEKDIDSNMQHMEEMHSFFIPDREFLIDLPGFIAYLGEKISVYNLCLWCNENTKMFYSPESVQHHMITKGHCKIAYDGFGDDEFGEFYDFQEDAEELARISNHIALDETGMNLILPSGDRVGHRALMVYYKQKLRPAEEKEPIVINQLVANYSDRGWHAIHSPQARASIKSHQRKAMHQHLANGMSNNRQKHYREQNPF